MADTAGSSCTLKQSKGSPLLSAAQETYIKLGHCGLTAMVSFRKEDIILIKSFCISLLCVFASALLTVLGAVFVNSAFHIVDAVPKTLFTVLGITFVVLGVLA